MPFPAFWAEVTKDSQIIDFLDAFLLNVRKKNDVYKLQIAVLDQLGARQSSAMMEDEGPEIEGGALTTKKLVRQHMNRLLSVVLKFFYRLSRPVESDTDYFPLPVY